MAQAAVLIGSYIVGAAVTMAVQLPVICKKCGEAFLPIRDGILIGGNHDGSPSNIVMTGNAGPDCPYCGGPTFYPDGAFTILQDAVSVLLAPGHTEDELKKLADILRQQKAAGANAPPLSQAIEKELPAFKRIGEILEKHPFMKRMLEELVVIAVGVILESHLTATNVTNNYQTIVNQSVNIYLSQLNTPKAAQPKEPTRVAPKQGRNEKCACGSGKKFKRCCGEIK